MWGYPTAFLRKDIVEPSIILLDREFLVPNEFSKNCLSIWEQNNN